MPKILFEIARGIGIPIALDDATSKRTFGHFSRILVDVDLSGNLHDQILVERGLWFFMKIEYEKLPYFCSFCQNIGNSSANCKRKENYVDNHNLDRQEKDGEGTSGSKFLEKFIQEPSRVEGGDAMNVEKNVGPLTVEEVIGDRYAQ